MSETAVGVVTALAQARRATQLYPPTHPSFAEAVEGLVTAVRAAAAAAPFTLNWHQGRLYHESAVLPDDLPGMAAMAEAFEARRIESMGLHAGFGETDALGLTEVLALKPGPDLDVDAELASRGVSNVSIQFLADDDEEREERDRKREADRGMYNQLISMLRAAQAQMARGGTADLGHASGVVAGIAGRLGEDQAAILAMATMRAKTEADLFHSTNVMIYALTLGTSLGLPDEGLTSLGLSALLHDIGKSAFDTADEHQAQAIKLMHPSVGAQILGRLPGEDKASMLVAYEHHMGMDGSGYPERPADYIPHPYSRMIAIADRYENLTKPDPFGVAQTPDRAVVQILREARGPLDALFTRLFVKAIGVFPVGCLVRLSDMRVAVVAGHGNDALLPKVRVIYDENGIELEEPVELLPDEAQVTIIEVIDPDALAL
ncbi:MAG: HD domain-containing protein, partial [Actinobacteria bacterium]